MANQQTCRTSGNQALDMGGRDSLDCIMRATGGSATIAQVVRGLMAYEPEQIILFGSMARGDADEYSDLDLIIIKNTDRRFVQRLMDVTAFLPLDMAIDAFVYTPQELKAMVEEGNPFIERALTEGKVLYEKSPGDGPAMVGPG